LDKALFLKKVISVYCILNQPCIFGTEDDFDFGVKTQHASKVKLSKIFSSNSPKLLYVYDFGDSWVQVQLNDSGTLEFANFRTFALRTIPRRFIRKKKMEKKMTRL
jgi:hypothetical protein